ncbi:MAG: hypothetical protein U9O18_03180 [Chloroflexota bacterium]|nr:hypothetical protein [Chloroflexota bacterium]
MRRFILVLGATVALAISSVAPVAADHGFPVGECPDSYVLVHDTGNATRGGGGEIIIVKDRIVYVDANEDGWICVKEVRRIGAEPQPLDNNVPFRERIIIK